MKPLRPRIEALEGAKMTDAELSAEYDRLSRLYRGDLGMKSVIDRVAANPGLPSLADSILAARKRAGMNRISE
ncbi:hypothetical protein [uncultured Thiodictyon sp.]|uniref:hypothetical protein n=1 Tax=uncultured Thiodictyon sp. TaxID=1846217 RepID=UPI0025EC67AF|nr:hypothetical protein [uncultured Thiodictyon sp.]